MEFDYSSIDDSIINLNDIIFNNNQVNYSGIGGHIFKSQYLNYITEHDKSQNIYDVMCS